jgi:hypothetical protein
VNRITTELWQQWVRESMIVAELPPGVDDMLRSIAAKQFKQEQAALHRRGLQRKPSPLATRPDPPPTPAPKDDSVKKDIEAFLNDRKRGRVFLVNSVPRAEMPSPAVTS